MGVCRGLLSYFFCTFLVVSPVWSHVSLTFPPARKYALDFLDNMRLPKSNCGMPKGLGPSISIPSGSTFNITWSLAYPHKGGYKLEVLDQQDRPIMDLTPMVQDSKFLAFDATTQSHGVSIPGDFQCEDCSIRLLRQATEWNSEYLLKSCADVDFVLRDSYHETCMGNGLFSNGKCQCKKLFSGQQCQYRDECIEDTDCGPRGRCINIEASSYPKRQCYCEQGWFGDKCSKESPVKIDDLDLKNYRHRDLASDVKLYWKFLLDSGEIEIVLQAKGTSYIALGWRPIDTKPECKSFPSLQLKDDVRKSKELFRSLDSSDKTPDMTFAASTNSENVSPSTSEAASTLQTLESKTSTAEDSTSTAKAPTTLLLHTPSLRRPRPSSRLSLFSSRTTTLRTTTTSTTSTTTTETSSPASDTDTIAARTSETDAVSPSTANTDPPLPTTVTDGSSPATGADNSVKSGASSSDASFSAETTTAPSGTSAETTTVPLGDSSSAETTAAPSGDSSSAEATAKLDDSSSVEEGTTPTTMSTTIADESTGTSEPTSESTGTSEAKTEISSKQTVRIGTSETTISSIVQVATTARDASTASQITSTSSNAVLTTTKLNGTADSDLNTQETVAVTVRTNTVYKRPNKILFPRRRPILFRPTVSTTTTTTTTTAAHTQATVTDPSELDLSSEYSGEILTLTSIATSKETDRRSRILSDTEDLGPATDEESTESKEVEEVTEVSDNKLVSSKPQSRELTANDDISSRSTNSGSAQTLDSGTSEDFSGVDQTSSASEENEATTGVQVKSYGESVGDDEAVGRRKRRENDPSDGSERMPKATSGDSELYNNPFFPTGDFHPMDCTDMIIGSARGDFGRIGDFYSRDRSTPQLDAFFGGSDSLSAGLSFERDGVTTVLFRRKLEAAEKSDHTIANSPMHLIWARGQVPGMYSHVPAVGFPSEDVSNPNFYKADELKYHGHGDQRGMAVVNFYEDNERDNSGQNCRGEWSRPANCTVDNCEYKASWVFHNVTDRIHFTIFTKYSNKWTGIGFSKDVYMNNTDAIIGWVNEDGNFFMMDTWIFGYVPPALDAIQDIYNESGTRRNSSGTTLSFSRKRDTGDVQQDLAFSNTECLYMIFPYNGGGYNAVNKKLKRHESIPAVSTERVCIRACDPDVQSPPDTPKIMAAQPTAIVRESTTSSSTTLVVSSSTGSQPAYHLAIKLPIEAFLVDSSSEKIKRTLQAKIQKEVSSALQNATGFKEVKVTDLQKANDTSIIVQMDILVNDNIINSVDQDDPFAIENLINSSVTAGKIGNLRVDPSYIILEHPIGLEEKENIMETSNGIDRRTNEHLVAIYAITAAVSALGLLAFIQIICTIFRHQRAKNARTSKERLISNSGWKDYSTTSGNYNYEPFAANDEDGTAAKRKSPSGSAAPVGGSSGGGGGTRGSNMHANGGNNGRGPPYANPALRGDSRSLSRNQRAVEERPHYSRRSESLPRPNPPSSHPAFAGNSYATHDRSNRTANAGPRSQMELQPDFYFMPSQRRYSGEVVRVYVDYNNPNYTGK